MAKIASTGEISSIRLKESSAPSTPDSGYFQLYAKTDGKLYTKNDAGTEICLTDLGGGDGSVIHSVCTGRLTLTSGTPVTTSDVTAAGTLYFTPYNGNLIGLYSGSAWSTFSFSEISLALTLTSGKNYDVFVYSNSGTPALELSAAWTNDTARADALALQDGVWVKSADHTRRYVGTIRASGTNATEDSFGNASQAGGKRYVWNAYNRVLRAIGVKDTTDTWTYDAAAWRSANNAAGNKVEYVVGLSEDVVRAEAVLSSLGSTSGAAGATGIGIDATNANSAQLYGEIGASANLGTNALRSPTRARYIGYPGIGYHAISWLEYARTGTMQFEGDLGVADVQSGLIAEILA